MLSSPFKSNTKLYENGSCNYGTKCILLTISLKSLFMNRSKSVNTVFNVIHKISVQIHILWLPHCKVCWRSKFFLHPTKHPFHFKQYFRSFVVLKKLQMFTDISDNNCVCVMSRYFFLKNSQIWSSKLTNLSVSVYKST